MSHTVDEILQVRGHISVLRVSDNMEGGERVRYSVGIKEVGRDFERKVEVWSVPMSTSDDMT